MIRSCDAKRGSIFLIATVLVIVIIGATGGFLLPSMVRYRGTMRNVESARAFFLAEAGLSAAIDDLNDFQSANAGSLGDAENRVALAGGDFYTTAIDNGDYSYTVKTIGRFNGSERAIDSDLKRKLKSIWDNALIAGPGQAGLPVRGNTTIHGGAIVFGEAADGTGDVGPTDTVVDFSGTGGIKDNYEDINLALAAKIPALGPDGLTTEFRVKNGQVDLSGTGDLGQGTDGIDGFYSNGEVGGNQGETNIFSDNGTQTGYDVPDSYTLYSLAETYDDPNNPNPGSADGTWTDYYEFANTSFLDMDPEFAVLNASFAASIAGMHGPKPANPFVDPIVISGATPNFWIGDGGTFDQSTNRIRWTQATLFLEVDGTIRTNSSLVFGASQGPKETILYRGRATILAGDAETDVVTLNGDMLPETTFPTVDVLGIISGGDITTGGTAQVNLALVLFAEDTFSTDKQTQLAGAILADYFNMGTQVPQLFAVPTLKDNLPPGWIYMPPMPTTVFVVSWQKASTVVE